MIVAIVNLHVGLQILQDKSTARTRHPRLCPASCSSLPLDLDVE